MKMKKILLGLGGLVTIAAPVVAVVSCGAQSHVMTNTTHRTHSTEVMENTILNFDEVLLNEGTNREEAAEKEKLILEMKKQIIDKKATGFIFAGETHMLADYADEATNSVKMAFTALVAELAKYYPYTLSNSPQGFVTTGHVQFGQTLFEMPDPGKEFNMADKLPVAPRHTRWVASSNLFMSDNGTYDNTSEPRWWSIQGWKRPYSDFQSTITFKVKLEAEIGYKLTDAQETTLTFKTMTANPSENDIRRTLEISSAYSNEEGKVMTTLKQKDHVLEQFKVLINGKETYECDNSQLDTDVEIQIQKVDGIQYPEDQKWTFNMKPSESVKLVKFNPVQHAALVSQGTHVVIEGTGYTYYASYTPFGVTAKAYSPRMTSKEDLINWLKTIQTANHEVHISVLEKASASLMMLPSEFALFSQYLEQHMSYPDAQAKAIASRKDTMHNYKITLNGEDVVIKDVQGETETDVNFNAFSKVVHLDISVVMYAKDANTGEAADSDVTHHNYLIVEKEAHDYHVPETLGTKQGFYSQKPMPGHIDEFKIPEDAQMYIDFTGATITGDVNRAFTQVSRVMTLEQLQVAREAEAKAAEAQAQAAKVHVPTVEEQLQAALDKFKDEYKSKSVHIDKLKELANDAKLVGNMDIKELDIDFPEVPAKFILEVTTSAEFNNQNKLLVHVTIKDRNNFAVKVTKDIYIEAFIEQLVPAVTMDGIGAPPVGPPPMGK